MTTEPRFPPVDPSIRIHNFTCQVSEQVVGVQVTKLAGQVMIWVGGAGECGPTLGNLAAGVLGPDCPATALLGTSSQANTLAGRLAKKLCKQVKLMVIFSRSALLNNVQVFLSFNFAEDEMLTPLVVAELMKIIKDNPECF